MKLNLVPMIIVLAISSLISYGFYNFQSNSNKEIVSISSFLLLALTLVFTTSIKFDLPRTATNIKTTSVLFFVISIICNLIFSLISFSIPIYIIVNGIILMVYILILYSINREKQ